MWSTLLYLIIISSLVNDSVNPFILLETLTFWLPSHHVLFVLLSYQYHFFSFPFTGHSHISDALTKEILSSILTLIVILSRLLPSNSIYRLMKTYISSLNSRLLYPVAYSNQLKCLIAILILTFPKLNSSSPP